MFGVIVAGRLVQTEFQQVDETRFTIVLPGASSINHLVTFLTGQVPFPDGYGGSVYLGTVVDGDISWSYLGFVSNEKPSAIFKVAKLKRGSGTSMPAFLGADPGVMTDAAQLGIAVEPLTEIASKTAPDSVQPSTLPMLVQFANKMIDSFVNYAWSFANGDVLPVSVVQRWQEQFQRRMQQNPFFWRE